MTPLLVMLVLAPGVDRPSAVARVSARPLRLAQSGRIAVGHAPVIVGNLAAARERALEDALRQAVLQALTEMAAAQTPPPGSVPAVAPPPISAAATAGILGRARSYVRRYRVLAQGPQATGYQLEVDAEIDGAALRRDLEKLQPAVAVAPAPTGGPASLTIVASGPPEGAAALVSALTAAGVRVGPSVPSGGAAVTATVATTVAFDGPVRGTGKVAIQCRVGARLALAANGASLAEESAATRGFAESPDAAQKACFARAAAELVARLTPALATPPAPSAGTRTVTLDVDIVEAAALPALLRVLRGVGSVSSAEVRRILAGRAEIRVGTRLSASALAAATARDAQGTLAVTNIEAVGDLVRMRVRGAPQGTAPPEGASPAPGAP